MKLDDKLYTSTEVAEILGVSLRSVYRYLEEDKLQAEVKTATGRHRFTKQNILDFLYPDGNQPAEAVKKEPKRVEVAVAVEELEEDSNEAANTQESEEELEEQEEEVDWLEKFRAAAAKHREAIREEREAPVQEESTKDSLSSLATEEVAEEPAVPEEEEVVTPTGKVFYYTSSVGGLKELAQYVNKAARKSNVDYAFTMNAGMSLHKLIKPFSLLHVSILPEDKEFFEKALELTPADQNSAQIALVLANKTVMNERKEIHGLYVVSDMQLRKDLLEGGELELASELDEVLNL